MFRVNSFIAFLFLATSLSSMLFISCGGPGSNIDAGKVDSVNAKYKDNAALTDLNSKIKQNPNVDSLYRLRSREYLKMKDYELALGDANRALALDSSTSQNYLLLTDIYYITNQTRLAKETLEHCLTHLPNDKDAHLKMAELFFYVKKYQESLDHVNAALKIDPYHSKAYFLKGMNYMEIGDTAKAISSMQTAVEQDNEYYTAYMQLGILHYHKKNPICLAYFDNAMRIQPLSTEAMYAKARYLQDIKKYKEAKNFYEQIIKLDPMNKNSVYNTGAILLKENQPQQALKYFTDAINIDSEYTEAWFARGVCYEQLNDKAAARSDYKTALKITANFEPAVAALNKLESGK